MIERKIPDLIFGKNLVHLLADILLLPGAPEIIEHQEPASKQIFAEASRIFFRKLHMSRLDNIYERELENILINRCNGRRFVRYLEAAADPTAQPIDELSISFRIIGHP